MIQVHGKFKLFATDYEDDKDLHNLMNKVEDWVKEKKVAPKSIGVEYLEGTKTLIMSIGYRDDESYPVTLTIREVGQLDTNLNFEKNEADIANVAKTIDRIICHELFITEDGKLHMVFMCKQ